jgi:GNAT superfamily N-acetyltransferase
VSWHSSPRRILKASATNLTPEILFADLDLARRVEAAWDCLGVENARALRTMAPESAAEAIAVGDGHAVFMGAGSPLSQAQGLGLHGPVPEPEIALMEAFFRDRQTLTQIEVASLADQSLLSCLTERGYMIAEQTHLLVASLATESLRQASVNQSEPTAIVDVARVEPDKSAFWVDMVLGCFFEEPAVPPPALRAAAIAMARVAGFSAWMARVDQQPAGGASMVIHDGLALFCGDGTLPSFRHRGVQTALIRARLAHALAAGCRLAVTCTQPGSGSQRNAERQGFRVAYARTMMTKL